MRTVHRARCLVRDSNAIRMVEAVGYCFIEDTFKPKNVAPTEKELVRMAGALGARIVRAEGSGNSFRVNAVFWPPFQNNGVNLEAHDASGRQTGSESDAEVVDRL